MQAKTLECQLSQAQLGRYLAGEMLSPEAERQLEAHVSECPLCKNEVALRKQALQAAASGFAVVQTTESNKVKNPKSVRINLLDAARERKSLFTKPVVLSSALAIVLYAMSVFANNPSKVFGPRLSDKESASPIASTTPLEGESTTKAATPPTLPYGPVRPEGWVEPEPTIQSNVMPTANPASTPPVADSQPKQKRKSPARRANAPAATSGIRVYDPNGQPLGGN